MPLARYFCWVSGALVALLWLLDAYLPKYPVADRAQVHAAIIRIQSERKWPERIVYDTSGRAATPSAFAQVEVELDPSRIADVAVGPSERDAFAQLRPAGTGRLSRIGPEVQPRPAQRRIARKGISRVATARPPQPAWFGRNFW